MSNFLSNKKLIVKLAELKLARVCPRSYLSNFFTNLQNKIDIALGNFLIEKALDLKASTRVIEEQLLMIEAIKRFENDRFSALTTNRLNEELGDLLRQEIKMIEASYVFYEASISPEDYKKLDQCLYETGTRLERSLMQNRSIIFLSNECKLDGLNHIDSFGKLVIIEDEYISERGYAVDE